MNSLRLINLISVGIFGMVLSATFCDIIWTRKKIMLMVASMAVLFLFQGCIYYKVDFHIVEDFYPLITHLPLILVLCSLNRKCLWPTISVLTAYLCCQIRRWLALLIVAIFSGDWVMQNIAELILTLPILLILVQFISPAVRSISHYPISMQLQFGLVPTLYYGFDYLTRIYTDLLLNGVLVAVEFMPFVCSGAYLLFVVHTSAERQTRNQLEETQMIMNMQIEQAIREIEALRESQKKTSIYRHDMRHHMQYLSSCIENEQFRQAQEYIQKIYSETEASKVTVFCENEAANLIFSAFAKRADDRGIQMKIQARLPDHMAISESDLCVLLSNVLENALHACEREREKQREGMIKVSMYEKKGRLFLEVINSCDEDIIFHDGIPVTDIQGHGIGIRSICTIVEQFGGIYSFSAEGGQFILRIVI